MRISLVTRGARAFALATLVLSLGLSPSFARMGGRGGAPFAHPAFGSGHFAHFAPRGFNHFGFHRFGPNRFDRSGFHGFKRFGFNRFNRFNRFGFDRFGRNQLFIGGLGCCGWGGAVPVPTAASEPTIVGDRAPVIINIGADPGPGAAGAGYAGRCVTHKLIYDSAGKYAGERQTAQC